MGRKLFSYILLCLIILFETSPLAHAYICESVRIDKYNSLNIISNVLNNRVNELTKRINDKKEAIRIKNATKRVVVIKGTKTKQTTEVIKEVDEVKIPAYKWAKGQCTEYVAQRVNIMWRGNAGT